MEIEFRAKALKDYKVHNIKKGDWVYGYVQYKVIQLMARVFGSKETIVRLLRLLLQGQEFAGDNHININLNMPLTICGECGEFVHNGMACSNPECTGNAETVYTSKQMLHGLLSVRSRKRMLT